MMKRLFILIIVLAIAACGTKKTTDPQPGGGPEAFTLLLPVKDQVCTTGSVLTPTESSIIFQWNASKSAGSYELVLKNLLTQAETKQTVTSTQATATLLRNTPYSWYINAKSANSSDITKSETWKFYNSGPGVESYAPYPAELLTPGFGEIVTAVNGKVNLTWKGSSAGNNIDYYNVFFGPSNNPPLVKAQTKDSFVNDVTVTSGSTYYWTVITVDKNGNVSTAPMANFYVK
jgi:hypothetical protein